jgi:hypothetical protein
MAIERRLNDPALDAASASMNQPHFRPAFFHGGIEIVADDRRNVARRERMKIELALDRNSDRLVHVF